MKPETEYALRKRIKELEVENDKLRPYRSVFIDIFNVAITACEQNKSVATAYIIGKARNVFQ